MQKVFKRNRKFALFILSIKGMKKSQNTLENFTFIILDHLNGHISTFNKVKNFLC